MLAVLSALHLLTLSGTEISARPDTVIDAVVGQDVHFPVDNRCEDQSYVAFHLLSPVVTKLASLVNNISGILHPVYADRLHWDASGSLVLSNVQVNDSKRYGIQIDCTSQKRTTHGKRTFDVYVFEAVSKPVITKTGNCSTPNITLRCYVSNGTNVTICWEIHSLFNSVNTTCNGPELVIHHMKEGEQHRCIAKNRVSNASSEPTIIEPCNGNVYKNKNLRWLLASPVFLLILVVIIFSKHKMKHAVNNKRHNRSIQRSEEKMFSVQHELIEPTYVTMVDSR
ncbi:hepatocyte cell adhesion molecule-like isoform X2 [Amblyraja radiata]|uniref:hepatocyte cell adhesion molecule-like isoform X2 n=1 Tax=Amblyraja radiata TaxID=386614 RepID=UPI0014025D56|nr:hepatocyte cell adhesion molecule-like isoform X2 [Amblyraja radiata]XP_032887259.1 hepatocyte cell adhesion molecule-like isoform X2 [Amblyraja radiata]